MCAERNCKISPQPSTIAFSSISPSHTKTTFRPRNPALSAPISFQSKPLVPLVSSLTSNCKVSDKRETQEKLLMILRNAEDYPTWKSYTISKLQQVHLPKVYPCQAKLRDRGPRCLINSSLESLGRGRYQCFDHLS